MVRWVFLSPLLSDVNVAMLESQGIFSVLELSDEELVWYAYIGVNIYVTMEIILWSRRNMHVKIYIDTDIISIF